MNTDSMLTLCPALGLAYRQSRGITLSSPNFGYLTSTLYRVKLNTQEEIDYLVNCMTEELEMYMVSKLGFTRVSALLWIAQWHDMLADRLEIEQPLSNKVEVVENVQVEHVPVEIKTETPLNIENTTSSCSIQDPVETGDQNPVDSDRHIDKVIAAFKAASLVSPICEGRKGKKKGRPNGRGRSTVMPVYRAPRQMQTWQQTVVPPQLDMKLTMSYLGTLTGGGTIVSRWNPNSAYQPQVSGATATVPGYSEAAAFYGFYRVTKYSYVVDFSNLEAFPVTCYVVNSNNDPGTTASVVVSAGNAMNQTSFLSAKGGMDRKTFSKNVTLATLLGSDAIETADSYRSLINGSPSDITWLGLGAQSGTGTALTVGVVYRFSLTMYCRFYDRLLQT